MPSCAWELVYFYLPSGLDQYILYSSGKPTTRERDESIFFLVIFKLVPIFYNLKFNVTLIVGVSLLCL